MEKCILPLTNSFICGAGPGYIANLLNNAKNFSTCLRKHGAPMFNVLEKKNFCDSIHYIQYVDARIIVAYK